MSINYRKILGVSQEAWRVLLNGKTVGVIKKLKSGYAYRPDGHGTYGDSFDSLLECQKSLEEEG